MLGELVCAGINVMGFDWIAAPACTELECLVLDWLGKLLNLPPRLLPFGPGPGGAVIQGSAGEAAIVVSVYPSPISLMSAQADSMHTMVTVAR